MRKIILFFSLLSATSAFADSFILNNQTSANSKETKLAIQWAFSAKEVAENNNELMQGKKFDSQALQFLTSTGKLNLNIPEKAEFFRVLAWSKGMAEPDLLTNWVDVVPNKTYTLTNDYLIPKVLMFGMGC